MGRSRASILRSLKFVENGFIKIGMEINFEAMNSKIRVLSNFEIVVGHSRGLISK